MPLTVISPVLVLRAKGRAAFPPLMFVGPRVRVVEQDRHGSRPEFWSGHRLRWPPSAGSCDNTWKHGDVVPVGVDDGSTGLHVGRGQSAPGKMEVSAFSLQQARR